MLFYSDMSKMAPTVIETANPLLLSSLHFRFGCFVLFFFPQIHVHQNMFLRPTRECSLCLLVSCVAAGATKLNTAKESCVVDYCIFLWYVRSNHRIYVNAGKLSSWCFITLLPYTSLEQSSDQVSVRCCHFWQLQVCLWFILQQVLGV